MNIVLIGMPGSGKTMVGELLAKKMNYNFVDVDSLIEKSQHLSINEIFASKGEAYFRKVEADIIKNIEGDNKIISLGGGAFENKETRELLLSTCKVIYLTASAAVIYERIKSDKTRPLLNNNKSIETIQNMLNIREKNYKLAHYTVLTDNKSGDEIVNEILNLGK